MVQRYATRCAFVNDVYKPLNTKSLNLDPVIAVPVQPGHSGVGSLSCDLALLHYWTT